MEPLDPLTRDIIGFVILGISILFSSYLTRKAINQANVEDGKRTTTIVESVKHAFQKELEVFRIQMGKEYEIFRSDLESIKRNQRLLNDEERNALVEFSSESEKQIHSLSDFSLSDFLTQSIEQNYNAIGDVSKKLTMLFTSFTKVEIFVDNLEMLASSSKLFETVLAFASKANEYGKEISLMVISHNNKLQELQTMIAEKDSSGKSADDFKKAKEKADTFSRSKPQLLKRIQEVKDDLSDHYIKCFALQRDFNEAVGKHLRSRQA